jgi:membrane fusion protein (multidrug efflux system)
MRYGCAQGKGNPLERAVTTLLAVFLIAGSCLLTGCEKKTAAKEEKVFNVKTMTVRKQSLRPYIEAVGSLEPSEQVIVSSEVDGALKEILVDEGSPVAGGSVMGRISDIDYRLGVQAADAALGQARANLDNAGILYARMEALYGKQAVSRQEYDNAKTRLDVANEDMARARASLDLARDRLGKTALRAPSPGW